MKTIYKYQIPIKEAVTLQLPKQAKILRVDGVDGGLFMWALVDTDNPLEPVNLRLFKTGGEIPQDTSYEYLGHGAIFIQMELMLYVFKENVQRVAHPCQTRPSITLPGVLEPFVFSPEIKELAFVGDTRVFNPVQADNRQRVTH